MTRWHGDAPIPPVGRLSGPRASASVAMFRTDSVAAANLRAAQAFYRQKLRTWAKNRAAAGIRPRDDADDDFPG